MLWVFGGCLDGFSHSHLVLMRFEPVLDLVVMLLRVGGRACVAGDVAALFCEFLEVCIHQLLSVREVYPPG